MASITLDINGRRYNLGCDDGEEARLTALGERLDARIRSLADQFGQIGDQRLLLMASLTLMDEYDELAGNMEARADALVSEIEADAKNAIAEAESVQASTLEVLEKLADRAETVLGKLPE